jgi:putative transposase
MVSLTLTEASPMSMIVTRRYPTDLTDAQWERIRPLIPPAKPGGNNRTTSIREVINAIFYLLRTGCAWRMLPKDFPPKSTVYDYFRLWKNDSLWQNIHDRLRGEVRQEAGREITPSAAILDSQSTKTTEKKGVRGYDAGKKVTGRKRHILVDSMGLLLLVVVHAANLQDRDGAKLVLKKARGRFPRLKLIWADGGYAGKLIDWVEQTCGWVLEIVKRNADLTGFHVLPHRWVVERTFGWLGRYRRFSKDYEEFTESSEAMIHLAMIHLMLRRLHPISKTQKLR